MGLSGAHLIRVQSLSNLCSLIGGRRQESSQQADQAECSPAMPASVFGKPQYIRRALWTAWRRPGAAGQIA